MTPRRDGKGCDTAGCKIRSGKAERFDDGARCRPPWDDSMPAASLICLVSALSRSSLRTQMESGRAGVLFNNLTFYAFNTPARNGRPQEIFRGAESPLPRSSTPEKEKERGIQIPSGHLHRGKGIMHDRRPANFC